MRTKNKLLLITGNYEEYNKYKNIDTVNWEVYFKYDQSNISSNNKSNDINFNKLKIDYKNWIHKIENKLNNTTYFSRLNSKFDLNYFYQTFPRDFYRNELSVINLFIKLKILKNKISKKNYTKIIFKNMTRNIKIEIYQTIIKNNFKIRIVSNLEKFIFYVCEIPILFIKNILSAFKFIFENLYIFLRIKSSNISYDKYTNLYIDYLTIKTKKIDKKYRSFHNLFGNKSNKSLYFHRLTNLKADEIIHLHNTKTDLKKIYNYDTYSLVLFISIIYNLILNILLLPILIIDILKSNLEFKYIIIDKIFQYTIGENFVRNYFCNHEIKFIMQKFQNREIKIYFIMENQNWEYALQKYSEKFLRNSNLTGLIHRKKFYWDNRFFFMSNKKSAINSIKIVHQDFRTIHERRKNYDKVNSKNENEIVTQIRGEYSFLIFGDYDIQTTTRMVEIIDKYRTSLNKKIDLSIKFHPLQKIDLLNLNQIRIINDINIDFNKYNFIVANYYSNIVNDLHIYKNKLLIYCNPSIISSIKDDFDFKINFFYDFRSFEDFLQKKNRKQFTL